MMVFVSCEGQRIRVRIRIWGRGGRCREGGPAASPARRPEGRPWGSQPHSPWDPRLITTREQRVRQGVSERVRSEWGQRGAPFLPCKYRPAVLPGRRPSLVSVLLGSQRHLSSCVKVPFPTTCSAQLSPAPPEGRVLGVRPRPVCARQRRQQQRRLQPGRRIADRLPHSLYLLSPSLSPPLASPGVTQQTCQSLLSSLCSSLLPADHPPSPPPPPPSFSCACRRLLLQWPRCTTATCCKSPSSGARWAGTR